ncbi:unnamed protein product, partial [Polarella glacialis]
MRDGSRSPSRERRVSRSRTRSRRSSSRSRSPDRSKEHVMYVAQEKTGSLIGRGGENINNLCRETGARIEVSRDDGSAGDRKVTITGSSNAIERGIRAIEDCLREGREGKGRGRGSREDDDGDCRKVIMIAQEFVGMLIGKGGENVKSLSRDSGARIEVSRDDGDRDADRTVTIIGSREAVDKATRMVEEVAGKSRLASGGGGGGKGQKESESEEESEIEAPPGFEPCEEAEWLYHTGNQEYLHTKTGRICWKDANTGMFGPIMQGEVHQDLTFIAAASTGPVSAASDAEEAKRPAPKTVVIPDLHRVAQALKLPFDHVDRPCAMVAVFGAPPVGVEGPPVEIVARSFHEKLLRRMSSWRSMWLDQAWFGALTGAMFDVAQGFNG